MKSVREKETKTNKERLKFWKYVILWDLQSTGLEILSQLQGRYAEEM